MKSYSYFYRAASLVSILMILSLPFQSISQETSDGAQAVIDAKYDAKASIAWPIVSFLTATAFGCIGGSVVLLTSQVVEPSPPTNRFIGKSTEYVILYTDTYHREVKRQRLISTSAGCIGGSALAAFIVVSLELYEFYEF